MDPEEALRLKAEAARIAAEVFASAGSAAEAPDEDGEPTKASPPQLTCCSSQIVILTEDGPISLLPHSHDAWSQKLSHCLPDLFWEQALWESGQTRNWQPFWFEP